MNVQKLTTLALLLSLALIIFIVESYIPPLTPIPVIKLGLSNIITLVVLMTGRKRDAFILMILRILTGSLFSGGVSALLYSASGGIMCFLAEIIIMKFIAQKQLWVISAIGAVFHNIGQTAVAMFITNTVQVAVFIIPLAISGIITGIFTGLCAYTLLNHANGYIYKKLKNNLS